MKRLFDIISSGIGLVILSPVFVILAFLIKVDSKGPVFYRQKRVGRNNTDFLLYKFRTMRPGSDRQGLITIGDRDPRVSHSGYYLRKYKLDELPQLINVFLGDMSLVGPRPEVRKYVEMYSPEQMRVLRVRPGITSLASIRYRNENDILAAADDPDRCYIEQVMPDKLAIDIEYTRNATLWYDFKIIISTIREVILR